MKFRTLIFYFIFFSVRSILFSSTTTIDSLKSALKINDPNAKSLITNKICENYLYLNSDSALKYGFLGIEAAKKAGLRSNQAYALNNIGLVFIEKGEFEKALNNLIEAEKIFESENNTEGKTSTSLNLGRVYELQNLFEKALAQYKIALSFAEKTGNKKNHALVLNHIGAFYYSTNEKSKSLEYFQKVLSINKETNDLEGQMGSLNNIAVIYQELGNFKEALNNFKAALDHYQKTEDKKSIVISYHNIALVYKDQKDYGSAINYLDSCITLAKEIKDFDDLQEAYSTLSEIYKEQNNYLRAFESFQLSVAAKDSLLNQTRDRQFIEMSTKYDTEKKEAENKLLKIEGEKQRAINTAITISLFLIAALAFFIFRGYRQKQKANILLGAQNAEISEKKNIIEVKQKEILDSISYAKRLQDAILPPVNSLQKHLQNIFVYYKPKDIVAGDFYWMETLSAAMSVADSDKKISSEMILVAAADCTGHGVPGAMVSVVCSNALFRTVKEFNLTEPGKILDKTRELVLETFSKGNEDVKDGMDISLVSISKDPFSEEFTIQWAGANNPLWYIKNQQFFEIKANKQPIGKTEKTTPFVTHKMALSKGDSLFLFTDGYADQFGGAKGKKFKYKQLQAQFINNAQKTMNEQHDALAQTFDNWKGPHEQVDDVCIIGIRL